MAIRYLLDEHIAPAYRTELLRYLPDLVVCLIGDPGGRRKVRSIPKYFNGVKKMASCL